MRTRSSGQGGWTQLEVLLAGFLGLTMVLASGYLFTTQVSGYQDIKDQAKIQSGLKLALQGMTRQISNAGACLANPLQNFSPQKDRITFSYVDVRGHFCDEDATVIVSFYTRAGDREDALMEDIRCDHGDSQSRTLASVPTGGLDLSFQYLDKNGSPTNTTSLIKAVQLDIGMQTGKKAKRAQRTKSQSIRVQCVNLI
jgi:hypothetical protein